MRKLICLLLPLVLCCQQRPLFERPVHESSEDDRTRPSGRDSLTPETHVVVTAVVFPDTLDWRKGTAENARLVVLKDGATLLSLPLSGIPSAEDHSFQDGHLWEFTSDGFRTFLYCDGVEFFSWEGQETLRGLLIHEGQIYTLGQKPGGGLCYRVNGENVFTSQKGTVLGVANDPDWPGGALCADGQEVYYSYGVEQVSANAPVWEYRVMRGGEIWKEITLPRDGQLYDMRVQDGTLYRLEMRYGRYCFFTGESLTALPRQGTQRNLKLLQVDGVMMAKGMDLSGREPSCWMQGNDSTSFSHADASYPVGDLLIDQGASAVVMLEHEGCVFFLVRGGEVLCRFPLETYKLHTARCAAFRKGVFAVALTHEESDEHLLVVNGEKKSLRFNGYFTGVYIE